MYTDDDRKKGKYIHSLTSIHNCFFLLKRILYAQIFCHYREKTTEYLFIYYYFQNL